jgi:hypothetical protein
MPRMYAELWGMSLVGGRAGLLIPLMLSLWLTSLGAQAAADPGQMRPAYPESLAQEVQQLVQGRARESLDPNVLLRLAELYLDMGDDLFSDKAKRIEAYEEGANNAQRALAQGVSSAAAHFLYAANAGSAAQLKGLMASALMVQDLKSHVSRALELEPDHAPALHMMGMMLEELPWFLGGDSAAALDHLLRAVGVDPNYAHARLDLAKAYLKRRKVGAAKRELDAIVTMTEPRGRYAWTHRYRPEAERLLAELASNEKK